eukprot:TRINITY_DN5786_c0_g1_i1.p1 TRINITY_DN5786_c0_g1~~TRINITY_DN5786_c0_g1_i1.p1  ORF type:complete len:431 (+),score=33.27 TRINITY_DN5786_c0_g1_i1:652-1944(+)
MRPPLIVCIDDLTKLRDHLIPRGVNRCAELIERLMNFQDNCTDQQLPEIRFVWTAFTELFEAVKANRQIDTIPLLSLSHKVEDLNLLKHLDEELGSSKKLISTWLLSKCGGNPGFISRLPENILSGLKKQLIEGGTSAASFIVNEIHNSSSYDLVTGNDIAVVLTRSFGDPERNRTLRNGGALYTLSNGVTCLNPILVFRWAKDICKKPEVKKWLTEYFENDADITFKNFERMTLYYEGLLNHSYRKLQLKPTLSQYFSGAFISEGIRDLIVHPREVVEVKKPESLANMGHEALYEALVNGHAVYSQKETEAGVDLLIPLFLSSRENDPPELHLFGGQCKLVVKLGNISKAQKLAEDALVEFTTWAKKRRTPIATHSLFFTTHEPKEKKNKKEKEKEKESESLKGVWFRNAAMENWLCSLGLPRVNYREN